MTQTFEQRLWAKIDKRDPADCWPWLGMLNRGYGYLNRDGRRVKATRSVWRLVKGSDPGAMHVLHRCDNPACCNPGHLFLGTQRDNAQDMADKGRQWKQRWTHCVNGHPFNDKNTRRVGRQRHCRVCDAARKRARNAAKSHSNIFAGA